MCSSKITDDYYKYKMCPTKPSKCGSMDIYLSKRGSVARNITQLNKGETCQYRFYAECGAPTFRSILPASTLKDTFNITYVEWEKSVAPNIKKNWTNDLQKELAMKVEMEHRLKNQWAAVKLTEERKA